MLFGRLGAVSCTKFHIRFTVRSWMRFHSGERFSSRSPRVRFDFHIEVFFLDAFFSQTINEFIVVLNLNPGSDESLLCHIFSSNFCTPGGFHKNICEFLNSYLSSSEFLFSCPYFVYLICLSTFSTLVLMSALTKFQDSATVLAQAFKFTFCC